MTILTIIAFVIAVPIAIVAMVISGTLIMSLIVWKWMEPDKSELRPHADDRHR